MNGFDDDLRFVEHDFVVAANSYAELSHGRAYGKVPGHGVDGGVELGSVCGEWAVEGKRDALFQYDEGLVEVPDEKLAGVEAAITFYENGIGRRALHGARV